MKFKKLTALLAAAVLLGGAGGYFLGGSRDTGLRGYANQFGDINGDGEINASDAALILVYAAYHGAGGEKSLDAWLSDRSSTSPTEPATQPTTQPTTQPAGTLTDEDKLLTIVGRYDEQGVMVDYYIGHYLPDGVRVRYQNLNRGSGDAPAELRTYLNSGADMDLYFAEPDWMRYFTDDPKLSMPLSALGITEAEYANSYPFAVEMGKNSSGELMAAAGEIFPGYFAYNVSLAKQYLGVTSPEQMQAKISDWSKFEETASELSAASGGAVTISASLEGLGRAYMMNTDSLWSSGNTPPGDQASDFLTMGKRFISNGYIDPQVSQWTSEWSNLQGSNKTLGFFYATWCLNPNADYLDSSGTYNIVEGPDSWFWGGNWLCVSPYCNTKKTAADFLRTCTVDTDRMTSYMTERSARMGAGYYLSSNRKAVQNYMQTHTSKSTLLGGQDPYPVLDKAAAGIRWDNSRAGKYDFYDKGVFLSAFRSNYKYSDSKIYEAYKSRSDVIFPGLY